MDFIEINYFFLQNYCLFNYMIAKINDRKIKYQPYFMMFFEIAITS